MFEELERRYLLRLARDCARRGLSAEATADIMHRKLGSFTCAGRLRCAIAHVFKTD
ncbi:MAG: hypothetical protein AAFY52_09800 [Pseudomonadota bacterium]